MAQGHNLFISYDLHNPGQNYAAVEEAIKRLGSWAKPNLSYWFVDSAYTPEKAAEIVWAVMDANDKLIVVDAKTNQAVWYNLAPVVQTHIKKYWNP